MTSATPALYGLAHLMRMVFNGGDLNALGSQLIERAQANPDDFNALQDLSVVLQLIGNRPLAMAVQADVLALHPVFVQPCTVAGVERPLRVAVIKTAGDLMANTPVELLLENAPVDLILAHSLPGQVLPEELPEHDVLFVAVGESDVNQPILAALEEALRDWPVPVINRPAQIAHMSREGVSALLAELSAKHPGLMLPQTRRVSRAALESVARGEAELASVLPVDVAADAPFPLIIRPVDSHAGHDLYKVDSLRELATAFLKTPSDEFYLARFVDYRSADGQYRKYRVVMVEGQPFASHMAISDHWMVHYLNAGMDESAEKRTEEAAWMLTFALDGGFAARHLAALQAIQQCSGLDYLALDCAETPQGELLIFEIDTSMIVHALDSAERYPYKHEAMPKVFAAFQHLLAQRAGRNG